MNNFTEEKLKDTCRRIGWMEGLIDNTGATDHLNISILESLRDKLSDAIDEARQSNVVSLDSYRRDKRLRD